MKSLKNMPESLETMADSVRLRPLLWKFLITGAMFWILFWSGRIKVGRWNERVRAKRCDAMDWDYA